MYSFSTFINEKLMIFGKSSYPKFGHVVILAGGAGSGKGFQSSTLLGIEGKTLDVDELKKLAIGSTKFAAKVKEETGHDLKSLDLKVPENVSRVHEILSSVYNMDKKRESALFASILTAPQDRKPNIIFDVTLKGRSKLESITRNVKELGYDPKNIHIVWVVNKIDVAIEQNKSRDRVVPEEILLDTHEGAAMTMKAILDMGDKLKSYMDGVIYLTFNAVGIDTSVEKSGNGGKYVKDANYIKVKEVGKRQLSSSELGDEVYDKIKSYVPKVDSWK